MGTGEMTEWVKMLAIKPKFDPQYPNSENRDLMSWLSTHAYTKQNYIYMYNACMCVCMLLDVTVHA